VNAYLPTPEEMRAAARRAPLGNPLASARARILEKVEHPPSDWDERAFLTVPGPVWTVSSDTCATGRLSAPRNVAYDATYREFVFRQPADETELASIMSADADEVFGCYRFDGLARWTSPGVAAWHADLDVVLGYVRHVLAMAPDAEVADGLREYEGHLRSQDLADYLAELRMRLEEMHGSD
jgi:hypothetical protein